MIVSDAPDQVTGLSRITRDLATLLAATPEFRVATLGTGGRGAQEFPWQQYQMGYGEFGELSLPYAWDNFSQGEQGIVFTIFDLSRLLWLTHPEYVQETWLKTWLLDARVNKLKMWSYLPIDSTGPHNKLTEMAKDVLMGIDRCLAYSPFGSDVIRNTIGAEEAAKRDLQWMPHGLNTRTFAPLHLYTNVTRLKTSEDETVHGLGVQPSVVRCVSDRHVGPSSDWTAIVDGRRVAICMECLKIMEVKEVMPNETATRRNTSIANVGEHRATEVTSADHVVRIGMVATNQARKDLGCACAVFAGLAERLKGNVKFWLHIDVLERAWNVQALIADFQLGEYVEITQPPVTDSWLAEQYRQCDVTILPSSEGFGFSWAESFACGVPCLHGDYAGGASLMRAFGLADYLIAPREWRLDGQYNCVRPVFSSNDWVERIMQILKQPPDPQWLSSRVEHLSYRQLGYVFRHWFKDGISYVK